MTDVQVNPSQAHLIDSARASLAAMSLHATDLLEVLQEWESRPTITSKRTCLTLSTLLATAFFVGVDYGDIALMGIPEGHEGVALSLVLFVGLILSGVSFYWNRRIDANLRSYRLSDILDKVDRAQSFVDEIKEILSLEDWSDYRSVNVYYNSGEFGQKRIPHRCKQMDVVEFYNNEVRGQETQRKLIEWLELAIITIIAAFGLVGLILFWIS